MNRHRFRILTSAHSWPGRLKLHIIEYGPNLKQYARLQSLVYLYLGQINLILDNQIQSVQNIFKFKFQLYKYKRFGRL